MRPPLYDFEITDHFSVDLLDWFRNHPEFMSHEPEAIARDARRYQRYGGNDHKVPDDHGIYFLVDSGEIVYVGKAECISDRLSDHWFKKRFDSYWSFGGIRYEWLEYIENFYIRRLRPRLNGRHPVNSPCNLGAITDQLGTIAATALA